MVSYPCFHERAVHWLYWSSRTWSSSEIQCSVKVASSCGITSQRIQGLVKAYFKINSLWRARKRINYLCENEIEKYVREDSLFVNTRQAS